MKTTFAAGNFDLNSIIMKLRTSIISGLILLLSFTCHAQEVENKWSFEKKHVIGSQLFMLFTPFFDPSPEYYQLSYGYRITPKDEISFEAITWTYQGPLGRPYGPDYEQEESSFPGDIKAFGGGIAYKRLIWKGLFAQLQSTAFRQNYRDQNKQKIQSGFQLFNTIRAGYHFKILKKRMFIAPSVACTFWPINTNLPESFQVQEDKWPNYFLFEPGLQFGFTF